MGFKGFSASYIAVDPFDGFEEMNSDSAEVTPFPGSLHNIYRSHHDVDEEEEDYETSKPDESSNVITKNGIPSNEAID